MNWNCYNVNQKNRIMKNVLWVLVCLLICFGCSDDAEDDISQEDDGNSGTEEIVIIPDMAFEQALIDLNYDEELDGEVDKSSIDSISVLVINDKGISDLTGISEFEALETLDVGDNQLSSLDVTDNTNLLSVFAEDNQLATVDVTGLFLLQSLELDRNDLQLISVRNNSGLQVLTLSSNQLVSIDVSQNTILTSFNVVDNPLTCILVSPTQLDNIPEDWSKDEEDNFSLDCE